MARSVLWLSLAAIAALLRLSAASPGVDLGLKQEVALRSDASDEEAREWLEQIKEFSETLMVGAKFFKSVNEEMSPAMIHGAKLVGCISNLIMGFTGDPTVKNYVKEIQALQKALNEAISRIQDELNTLIANIQEDFVKVYLAPLVSRLRSSVDFLTAYTQEDVKSDAVKRTYEDQMNPISDTIDAWNGVADCFLGGVSSCPSDMLSLVLNDGQSYPRPAVLVKFSVYHYNLLAASASAICAYQNISGFDSCGIDLTKLQDVASTLTAAHTQMKNAYKEETGANTLPSMFTSIINDNANRGYDGAVDIRDEIASELSTYWFTDGLWEYWNAHQWSLTIWHKERDSSWQSIGYLKNYNGYNVMWATANNDEGGIGVSDSDCTSGGDGTQLSCLDAMGAYCALSYWDTSSSGFFALASAGSYVHSFTSDGSCCKLHVVTPGYSTTTAYTQQQEIVILDGNFEEEETHPLALSVRPWTSSSSLSKRPRTRLASGSETSAADVMENIGNVFATAGAAVALFGGPAAEPVALALDFVGCVYSVIGGLMGMDEPDPVVEALRNAEEQLMGRFDAVSNQIATAQSTLERSTVTLLLNNAETPLKTLVGAWNDLYPNGNDATEIEFFDNNVSPISKHINAWNLIRDCITGTNLDCIFGDKSVLEVLLYDGQTWMRPLALVNAVKYYFILLQKSATAICGYGRLVEGDSRTNCPLLPTLEQDMQDVAQAMQVAVSNMKSTWDSQKGANMAPELFQYYIDANANDGYDGAKAIRDGIKAEFGTYYLADGMSDYFKAKQWSVMIWNKEVNSAWASSGYLKNYKGYNVAYTFANNAEKGLGVHDSDCTSGDDEKQRDCLQDLGAYGVVSYWDTSGTQFFALIGAGTYYHSYCSEGSCCKVHVVTPGYSLDSLSATEDPLALISVDWERTAPASVSNATQPKELVEEDGKRLTEPVVRPPQKAVHAQDQAVTDNCRAHPEENEEQDEATLYI